MFAMDDDLNGRAANVSRRRQLIRSSVGRLAPATLPLLQRLQAGPGEVLVTSTTRDLTVDSDLSYLVRGSFQLKGVPQPRTLWQ
jgi:hypothetical protein